MDSATRQLDLLLDLDARHDDLLRRLDELDQQVAKVLAEYQPVVAGIKVMPPDHQEAAQRPVAETGERPAEPH